MTINIPIKLQNIQWQILLAVRRRRDFLVYPLPAAVKRGDGPKHLKKLLSLYVIEEAEVVGDAPVWRVHDAGYRLTLMLSHDGLLAVAQHKAAEG